MDNLLVSKFYIVKQQLVGRYVNFVKQLLKSTSPEVCVVANMVARNSRSSTGKNLLHIERETILDPWKTEAWRVRHALPRSNVPAADGRRVQYLSKLLSRRLEMETKCQDVEEITSLKVSLSSS